MMTNLLPPKERILATATRLFNSIGVHTVGIDRIIDESGVAKKTFYNHYSSKNKLIAEYFRKKEECWYETLKRYTTDASTDPLERVLGIFDGLEEWYKQKDFFGCPFIRGLSDFSEEKDDPELVECIKQHFTWTNDYLAELIRNLHPKNYNDYLPQIMSLVAGGTVYAHATGDSGIARINRETARAILKN